MSLVSAEIRRFSSVAARRNFGRHGRRGAVVIFVSVLMVVLLGMAALTIDLGLFYVARTELQRCADIAAETLAQQRPIAAATAGRRFRLRRNRHRVPAYLPPRRPPRARRR